MFLNNIGDKSWEFANSVKDKADIFSKKSTIDNNDNVQKKETVNIEVQTEEHRDDYMTNMLKISQLSAELSQKDEYLGKSETKIIQLK